jgi:group I intron endonuclease
MTQVIYKIINLVNDKFYVGSTINKKVRFRQHRKLLRGNRHHCKHLQAAWNKYGEPKFDFLVIEEVPDTRSLLEVEDTYLMQHVGKEHCYNSGYSASAPWRNAPAHTTPNYGKIMSSEAKAIISAAVKQQWITSDPRTGQKHTEETKALISAKVQQVIAEGRGGCFIPSEETRRKMSASLMGNQNTKGHIRTEEHRRNLSIANKGNKNFLGKTHTEEAKTKIRKKVLEATTGGQFPSLTAVLQHYKMTMPTLRRALIAGTPIAKGKFTGLVFQYVDHSVLT